RFEQEAFDDLLIAAPAVGRLARIAGTISREVRRLPANAVGVAELVSPDLLRMDAHLLEQARERDYPRVFRRKLLPVVPDDQVTGEENLVPFPVGVSACTIRHETTVQ